MNETCSFSVFRESGPLKIRSQYWKNRSQYCLNFANSPRRSAASQFISGVLNPVVIVVRCVKPLNNKEKQRRIDVVRFGLSRF